MLNSSIAYHKQNNLVALTLTEEDRARVALTGATPADIQRIQSDDEDGDENRQQGERSEEARSEGERESGEGEREESVEAKL